MHQSTKNDIVENYRGFEIMNGISFYGCAILTVFGCIFTGGNCFVNAIISLHQLRETSYTFYCQYAS